ncbi:MAG TPA: GFA family protein, partial [Aquella sp.]|nr:GFA family protein [Aquella sp.]
GRELKCAFCQICGSRLWHEYVLEPDTISIKGGSLDSPLDVSNAIHVWTKHKLPGIIIPSNTEQYLEEPDECITKHSL